MSFYPKLIGAVCGVCAAGALIYAGVSAMDKAGVSTDGILSSKPTLTVWYLSLIHLSMCIRDSRRAYLHHGDFQ